jgi:hypothetical protein
MHQCKKKSKRQELIHSTGKDIGVYEIYVGTFVFLA